MVLTALIQLWQVNIMVKLPTARLFLPYAYYIMRKVKVTIIINVSEVKLYASSIYIRCELPTKIVVMLRDVFYIVD